MCIVCCLTGLSCVVTAASPYLQARLPNRNEKIHKRIMAYLIPAEDDQTEQVSDGCGTSEETSSVDKQPLLTGTVLPSLKLLKAIFWDCLFVRPVSPHAHPTIRSLLREQSFARSPQHMGAHPL
jgi:hypothetical protein